jgi:phosphoglucosamine mutase
MSSECDIAKEIDPIPSYTLLRESFGFEIVQDVLSRLGASSPTDGIRIMDEDGRCLIHASSTEPKIRITAEGQTISKPKALLARG